MDDTEAPDDAPKPVTALAAVAPATGTMLVPAMVADLGEAAALRFIDFFIANIRNPNTRAAYAVAVRRFFAWLEKHSVRELGAVRMHHVSAYVEVPGRRCKARRSSSTWRPSACCSTGRSSARWSARTRPPRCAVRSTRS
jgi:hypothetical protein